MSFEYGKLRGRIVEKFKNTGSFADAMGMSRVSLSNKLNNYTRFSSDDIIKACDLLEIDKEEIGDYFFTSELKQV